MIELGYFCFCFALLLAVYAFVTSCVCVAKPYISLVSSARNAIVGIFICLFIAALTLWHALLFHDFSVKYVYLHSAVNMPPIYLFTSFWSALEGSHFLWTLLLSFVCAFSLTQVKKTNLIYLPYLNLVYSTALIFMVTLTVTISAPLTRLFPSGHFGRGMNALLQNPYMAIHPPMLFTGYSLLIVPFAYAFAVLMTGFFTKDAFKTIRNAGLIAWMFLTTAIFLGGRWAYYELGWGGYWGWDPVENSSFMPWLALTASLHSFLITVKTQRLPRLSLFLTMLAFILTFQGTFITRSGIISSVHSFAESDIGPAYLAWILFLLSSTLILVFAKGQKIVGACEVNQWKWSKETSLLFSIFFFLFLLALVFIGTILPLVVEAVRGVKISIQQPFFNSFISWIGLGFVSLIGVGNLTRWKTGKIVDPLATLGFPALWSAALTLAFVFQKHLNLKLTFAYFMIFWAAGVLLMDFVFKLKDSRWNGWAFLKHRRRELGALIVHLGFLMAVLGFTGNYKTNSAEVSLKLNQSTDFHGYKITNTGLDYQAAYNVQRVSAKLQAVNEITGERVMIEPSRSKFTNNEQWFNEIGVHSTFWHDIYMVLSSFDVASQSVSLKMNENPTVKFVWTSLLVSLFGVLVSLSDMLPKSHRIPKGGKGVSVALLVFLVFCGGFAYSGMAHAQTQNEKTPSLLTDGSGNGTQLSGALSAQGDVIPMKTNSKIVAVAKELRCPTCLGMSILESGTPQSLAMRTEVEKQIQEGKSKAEIIAYFKSRYGSWILREPDFQSSYGAAIWIFCLLGFVAGPLFLVVSLKKANKEKQRKRQKLKQEIQDHILNERKFLS
jgi:cytochrome c-type biogenesis protein CcmF